MTYQEALAKFVTDRFGDEICWLNKGEIRHVDVYLESVTEGCCDMCQYTSTIIKIDVSFVHGFQFFDLDSRDLPGMMEDIVNAAQGN